MGCILICLILARIIRGRNNYYPHFIGKTDGPRVTKWWSQDLNSTNSPYPAVLVLCTKLLSMETTLNLEGRVYLEFILDQVYWAYRMS